MIERKLFGENSKTELDKLDEKIVAETNYLFGNEIEIVTKQKENISNKAKLIFNKTDDFLGKDRNLNFENNLCSIRFLKEGQGKEITMVVKELEDPHTAIANLRKDELTIKYGMGEFNHVSKIGGDRINHLIDLIEERGLLKSYKK